MAIEFELAAEIPAAPEEIYHDWLDSAGHARLTGGPARASDVVGATFQAWDGYISGRNLVLEPGRRIVQAWRTTDFGTADGDSRLEILLEPLGGGTRLILRHTGLPDDGAQYRQGWIESYFEPMTAYYRGRAAA